MLDDVVLVEMLRKHERALRLHIEERIPARLQAEMSPDDILQGLWLATQAVAPQKRPEKDASFLSWTRRIVGHLIIDATRRALAVKRGGGRVVAWQDRSSIEAVIYAAQAPCRTPSSEAAGYEAVLSLAHAVRSLPKSQREAVELYYLNADTYGDIARKTRRTPQAVNGLLHRALTSIRDCLGHPDRFFSDKRRRGGRQMRELRRAERRDARRDD
ncbi:MAG: hypothetical protein JSU63_20860 [Phycisphaerales bacterium]|nr:MAG: hypothetical protein JSU63_20860 [Phycisphaerales bacterium]